MALYVNYGSLKPFAYYATRLGIGTSELIRSSNTHDEFSWDVVETDVRSLAGKPRVWTLFSGVDKYSDLNEESLFLYFADRTAARRDTFKTKEPPSICLTSVKIGKSA